MTLGKDTRQTFFIDESRIQNFSLEKVEAANARSPIFNYMLDEKLINEFWKINNDKPAIDFSKEFMVHKDDFIWFVDKRISKNNDNILYSSNVQFETIIQTVYGKRSIQSYISLWSNTQEFQSIIMKDAIQIFYNTLTFSRSKKKLSYLGKQYIPVY